MNGLNNLYSYLHAIQKVTKQQSEIMNSLTVSAVIYSSSCFLTQAFAPYNPWPEQTYVNVRKCLLIKTKEMMGRSGNLWLIF